MMCENILLYANGELDNAQKQAFEDHLKTCKSCQTQLAFLQRSDEALSAPAAPAEVVEKLFAKTTRKKHFWTVWKTVLAGAVCAAVMGAVLLPFPDKSNTLNTEVLAYLSENLDADYQMFAADLAEFENEF